VNKYPVNDVYYTIQGEGVQTGMPAIFLRLHGCPVGCPFCDTRETWFMNAVDEVGDIALAQATPTAYTWQTAAVIGEYLAANWSDAPWVVLTGGEPSLYPLAELVDALHQRGYKVAIETSGTANGHVGAGIDWVTVSPKIDMPGKQPILAEAVAVADEIKHVVGRQQDIVALEQFLQDYPIPDKATICLQPMSQSARATDLAIATVKERGWRLSIQTHKYIAIP